MSFAKGLECLHCGATFGLKPLFAGCPKCKTGSFRANLTVQYDYEALQGKIKREPFRNARPGLWRFADLLPVQDPSHFISIYEGNTPLIPLPRVAEEAGFSSIFAKDETRNPTLSYKDRFCAVATAKALDFGAKATTISSTGNHGASAAAYASRAGLDCFIFTVSYTSPNMLTIMRVFGAKVVATRTIEDRWALMEEGVKRYGWWLIGSYTIPPTGNPYGVEGYKSLSFELAEQMNWKVPDFVIVPTAYSEGLYGCWKGFKELKHYNLIASLPRMVAAAPAGCDPLRVALEKNLDRVPMLEKKKTIAISIGAYTTGYQGLVALRESKGEAVSVSDEEILKAQKLLALEGIFAEASSAAAVAAAIKLGKSGQISRNSVIVCVITSSGLKIPDDAEHYLPKLPIVERDFEAYRRAVEETYHVHLE